MHAHLNGSLSREALISLGCLDQNVNKYQKLVLGGDKSENLSKVFDLFNVAHKATGTQESVYFATQSVIKDFVNDNVIYLELRTTPRSETGMTKTEYVEAVIRAITDNKDDMVVKLILSINRAHTEEEIRNTLGVILKMRAKYPELIRGVDLSGDPTKGNFCKQIFEEVRNAGLSITLHCAEIVNESEVIEMLEFRPERLGHGTVMHPSSGGTEKIWQFYSENSIPVECCLTSNVVCGTCKSYKDHHLEVFVKNELPFTLSTDDKGVFDTTLSQEFYLAAVNFQLSFKQLLQISINSVDYTFASTNEKQLLKQKLEAWQIKYCV